MVNKIASYKDQHQSRLVPLSVLTRETIDVPFALRADTEVGEKVLIERHMFLSNRRLCSFIVLKS